MFSFPLDSVASRIINLMVRALYTSPKFKRSKALLILKSRNKRYAPLSADTFFSGAKMSSRFNFLISPDQNRTNDTKRKLLQLYIVRALSQSVSAAASLGIARGKCTYPCFIHSRVHYINCHF